MFYIQWSLIWFQKALSMLLVLDTCRMHATSFTSNVHAHVDQVTKCKQPMKCDSERWLSFVEHFLNHCVKLLSL